MPHNGYISQPYHTLVDAAVFCSDYGKYINHSLIHSSFTVDHYIIELGGPFHFLARSGNTQLKRIRWLGFASLQTCDQFLF